MPVLAGVCGLANEQSANRCSVNAVVQALRKDQVVDVLQQCQDLLQPVAAALLQTYTSMRAAELSWAPGTDRCEPRAVPAAAALCNASVCVCALHGRSRHARGPMPPG